MRIKLLTLATVTLLAGAAAAQGYDNYYPRHMLWGVSWNVGVPTSDTKDYIDQVSFRGIGVEGRKFTSATTSIGFAASWQVFYEKSFRSTTTDLGAVVTGTQYRYLNTFPVLVNVYKHFGTYGSLRPYVGINAGMYIIENRLEVGLYALEETNVHVGAAPEVGVKLPSGRFLGFLGARYHFTTEAGNTPAQSFWEFRVGFGLEN